MHNGHLYQINILVMKSSCVISKIFQKDQEALIFTRDIAETITIRATIDHRLKEEKTFL